MTKGDRRIFVILQMQARTRNIIIGIGITLAAFAIAYAVMRPTQLTEWALFKGLAIILILAFTELARVALRKRRGA